MSQHKLRLNVGCGDAFIDGWENIDSSWHLTISKVPGLKPLLLAMRILPKRFKDTRWSKKVKSVDLRKPWPYPSNSCEAVYASHVIEHLKQGECKHALKEAIRVLMPGGVLRVIVPDLDILLASYLKNREVDAEKANETFVEHLGMVENPDQKGLKGSLLRMFGKKNLHKWIFNREYLQKRFEECGFIEIENMKYQQSRISGIHAVDRQDRFRGAICLEGAKPC